METPINEVRGKMIRPNVIQRTLDHDTTLVFLKQIDNSNDTSDSKGMLAGVNVTFDPMEPSQLSRLGMSTRVLMISSLASRH